MEKNFFITCKWTLCF